MKREELKSWGLTDEQIEQVMAEYGRNVSSFTEQAAARTGEIEGHKGQVEELSRQIAERNKQLEDLKKVAGTSEDLQAKISQLETDNKKAAEDFKAAMEKQQLDHAVDTYLISNKAKNVKAAKALLDWSGLSINKNGEVVGLKEQHEALVKSDGYLFGDGKPTGNEPPAGGNPGGAGGFAETFAKLQNENSSGGLDW